MHDPRISSVDWRPVVRDYMTDVSTTVNVPELIARNVELYGQIKNIEERLATMKKARVSEIIPVVTEWRRLVLQAQFQQRR